MSKRILLIVLSICMMCGLLFAAEGMWPMNEIHKLDLEKKGLQLSVDEIYNPNSISLVDGICKINGCTGSFVSPKGLMLTNHHCAYRAVQAASTAEHDYIKNGFLAQNTEQEIPAKNYTVRITESYKDVSDEVLSVVTEDMDFTARTKAVEKKIKQIEKQAEQQHPGKRADVAEMFIGKTYVLFIYTYLKDVRLVYAPPRSIGEFGGNEDNWIWPRHTGDFSFLRAYTGPDGRPAEYSPDNVPYRPKKFLKVAPEGVAENDFVFIFGYPGRTYRHRTSYFLAFEKEVRMPAVVKLYDWQIEKMKEIGQEDRTVGIKHLSRIKGLSNVTKNYKGKLLGLSRLQLVEKKRREEKKMQKFIDADPQLKQDYGMLLEQIEDIYTEKRKTMDQEFILHYMLRSSYLYRFGYTVYEAAIEREKQDIERESAYMDRNFDRTKRRLQLMANDYYEPTDKLFFSYFLKKAFALTDDLRPNVFDKISYDSIDSIYCGSQLNDRQHLMSLFLKSVDEIKKMKDPMIQFVIEIYPEYKKLKDLRKERKGKIDDLAAKLIDVKKEFLKTDFIPDANSTLRFTYGRIKGYSPRDAVYYSPITTLNGVIQKSTGEEPFDTPAKIFELYKNKDFGQFYNERLNSVPTGILYDMDTTGGNSGSPVLNARGELVGINFDRAFEATINDYAWSQDYSRSIGVDIRYVLWVTQKFSGADFLLTELNIPTE